MNSLKNKVQLIGHLGNNPEVKEFDGGRKLAKFSLATNESYKKENGEKVSETQWHNIIAWGNAATIVEKFLKKGNEAGIEGKLTSRSYEDKDGNKKYITEVVAHEILLMRQATK